MSSPFRSILVGFCIALCVILARRRWVPSDELVRPHSCALTRGKWVQPTTLHSVRLAFLLVYSSHLHLGLTSDYFFERGHAVAQLVEALRYKPKGRGLDSRLCLWNFWHNPSGRTMVLGLSLPVTEMITRNISFLTGDRYVGLTALLSPCSDCLEIWQSETAGSLRAYPVR